MEFLNIGPLELFFIALLAFIVLGPERMVSSARKLGKGINRALKSPLWSSIVETSHEIQDLPKKLIQDTGLDEDWAEIEKSTRQISEELKEVSSEVSNLSHVQNSTKQRMNNGKGN